MPHIVDSIMYHLRKAGNLEMLYGSSQDNLIAHCLHLILHSVCEEKHVMMQ